MSKLSLLILFCIALSCTICFGQSTQELNNKLLNNYAGRIGLKADKFNDRVKRSSEKALSRLASQEERLYKKLWKIDSNAAKRLFNNSIDSLRHLRSAIQNKSGKSFPLAGNYISYIDSAQTALKFLDKLKTKTITDGHSPIVANALGNIEELNSTIDEVEGIKNYISERRAILFKELGQYKALGKELQKINKEVYYYLQAVTQFRQLLEDPGKLESLAIGMLQKLPVFRDFFNTNSQMAGLFLSAPSAGNSSPVIGGLQPRSAVLQNMTARGFSASVNTSSLINQQAQSAKDQLTQLKDKIKQLIPSGSNTEVPLINGNSQKTKVFRKRLEYGGNVQFAKTNNFLPTTADIALHLGFKINDKSTVGTGVSYKAGFALKSFNDMAFSHEGIGLRSSIDYQLKGRFYLQGGLEYNYFSRFRNLEQLRTVNLWQQSALLGLSRKYSVSRKMNGSVQVLYDFLYHKHIPVSQPLLFRIGYSFK